MNTVVAYDCSGSESANEVLSKLAMQNSNKLVFSLLIIWSSIYTCLHNHLEGFMFATIQKKPSKVFTPFGVILSVISVTGHL
jgi:hypothetical protein